MLVGIVSDLDAGDESPRCIDDKIAPSLSRKVLVNLKSRVTKVNVFFRDSVSILNV